MDFTKFDVSILILRLQVFKYIIIINLDLSS